MFDARKRTKIWCSNDAKQIYGSSMLYLFISQLAVNFCEIDEWLSCCDRKSWAACAQSFAPWQQATIEITLVVTVHKHNQLFTRFTSIVRGHSPRSLHRDHSIIACSRHIYFCSSRTSRSWWITQSTQRHRRGCNIHNFYFEKAGNKQFWRFTPVINENHQFFHVFYVICTICLLALSSAYWAETQVWLGASNWVYVKWNQIVNDSYDRGWFL